MIYSSRLTGFSQKVAALVAAIAMVVVATPVAMAQSPNITKTFTASVSPSSIGSGTTTPVVFTITNTSVITQGNPQSDFKSGNIYIPTGITVTGVSTPNASWSASESASSRGNDLRRIKFSTNGNNGIGIGQSLTINASVQHVSAPTGNSSWSICVYHNSSDQEGVGGDFAAGVGMNPGVDCPVAVTVTITVIEQPPVDVCPNLDGVQTSLPSGYEFQNGNCVEIEQPPVDVCPNLDGVQTSLPSGYEFQDGNCVPEVTEQCPTWAPGTYPDCVPLPCDNVNEVRNDAGDCVPEVVDECPEGTTGEYPDCTPINPETPRVPVEVCKFDENQNLLSGWTMYGNNGSSTISGVTDEEGCVTLLVPVSTTTTMISVYEENRAGWTQESAQVRVLGVMGTTTPVTEGSHVLMCVFEIDQPTPEDLTNGMLLAVPAMIAPTLECDFTNSRDEEGGGDDSSSTTTSGGGGGGYTPRDRDAAPTPEVAGDSIDAVEPTPAVLGEQVSAVPYGAPNTGAGGTALPLFGFATTLLAMPRRFSVK